MVFLFVGSLGLQQTATGNVDPIPDRGVKEPRKKNKTLGLYNNEYRFVRRFHVGLLVNYK